MGSNPFSSFFEGLVVDATPRTAREWAMLAPEVRMGRFFLSAVEDEFLLNAVRDLCRSAMERGISDGEFVHEAWGMLRRLRACCDMPTVEFMPEGLSPEEVQRYQGDVRNVDSVARLQLIFRTQCDVAAGYREFQMAFDPVRLQGYPGWRFVRQPGARIKRPDHVAHEGAVRLKTDYEFWMARNSPEQGGFNLPFPPWGFNSWMLVEEVPREVCEALGLLAPGEPVVVPGVYEGFGLDVVLANGARASVRGLPVEARDRVVRRCAQEGIPVSVAADDPDVLEVDWGALDGVEDDFFRELAEIERILMGDDVEAARGCNQHRHVPGCGKEQTVHKGRSREHSLKLIGKERRMFRDSRCERVMYQNGSQVVRASRVYTDAQVAAGELQSLRDRIMCLKRGKMRGIPGKGVKAPGMDVEFFVTLNSVRELAKNAQHSARSVSIEAHLSAAAMVDQLWAASEPVTQHRDRKMDYDVSSIEWIYRRRAYMELNGKVYPVLMTAKQFKNKGNDNVLYDVRVQKCRRNRRLH